jgi:hypothetical protein
LQFPVPQHRGAQQSQPQSRSRAIISSLASQVPRPHFARTNASHSQLYSVLAISFVSLITLQVYTKGELRLDEDNMVATYMVELLLCSGMSFFLLPLLLANYLDTLKALLVSLTFHCACLLVTNFASKISFFVSSFF